MSNYMRLVAETMRTISGVWLYHGPTRAILEKYPKGAALLPDIEESHGGLCDAMGGDDTSPLEAQLTRLRTEGDVLDERHDRKYRGGLWLLNALIELADETDTKAALEALRERVYAKGLAVVNIRWDKEAGNAETLQTELGEGDRAQMRSIASVEGRTLDDEVQAWITAGTSLGPIAAEKAAVEQRLAKPAEVSSASALNAARKAWIKTARALETNLDLVKELTAEERSAVFGLLEQSAASAERAAVRRVSDEPQPAKPPSGPVTD